MERLSLNELSAAISVRKMHLLEGYNGESMEDLEQVKKEVYENFTSITKLLIACLHTSISRKENVKKIIGLNLTFKLILMLCIGKKASNFKLILKLCIGKKSPWIGKKVVINRIYVDILTHLEYVLCNCALIVINKSLRYPNPFLSLHNTNPHLWRKVAKVLSNTTKLGTSTYMIDVVDSVLELARNNCFKVDDLPDTYILLIKFLQFSKDYCLINDNHEDLPELFICVEVVFHTIVKRWWDDHCENLYICKAILKVLVMLVEPGISTPALTDEVLISYVYCIQLVLKEEDINNLMDPTKRDQLMILNEELGSFMTLLKHFGQEKLFDDDIIQPQAMLWNIGSLIYSVFNNGNIATERNLLQLPDLIEKVSAMKTQFQRTIIKRLMQASPHTDPFGFLNFFTGNMNKLMSFNLDDIIVVWKDQLQEIHEGLMFFRSFHQKVTPSSRTGDASQALSTRIKNAAYEAEYLVDSLFFESFPVSLRNVSLSVLAEEIKVIITECTMNAAGGIKKNDVFYEELIPITDSSNSPIHNVTSAPLDTAATNKSKYPMQTVNVVVGFEKEINVIMNQLTGNSKKRDVVLITGMPGLGKTTLAKAVYENPYIVNHFQCRAWCCVSQEYHKRKVLLTILSCIVHLSDEILKKSNEDLSVILHKELFGRRYLIVIDDVWVKDALEELQHFFPENGDGSRLMLTSRDKNFGSMATYHLELGLLTEEISWNLLEHKVYQNKKCPLGLSHVGKKIAQKCKGLPLAIVMVAGILLTSDEKLESWEQVAENLDITFDSQQLWVAALSLSYDFLPEHLKPLFLYIGAFPEDKVISAETLKWLWVAEGFVHKTHGNWSLEDEAEINLMDLTYRNLVMVAEKRYDGRIKAVRIHDLLREMSIRKAEEEMFFQQIHVSLNCKLLPDDPLYSCYRVCTSLSEKYTPIRSHVTYDDLQILSMAPPLHSLLCFENNIYFSSLIRKELFSLVCKFKLLRVLHFEILSPYDDLLSDTILLVRLRYISIKTSEDKLPTSISNLVNLESLIIKGEDEIVVPVEIWEMVKLRHIHITPRACFSDALKSSSKLENLQTLSTAKVKSDRYGRLKNLIMRIPNVRELKWELRSSDSKGYPQFKSLVKLESLELYTIDSDTWGNRSIEYVGNFSFASTLKELSLFGFHLQWNQISNFQNLSNLAVLKLNCGAVDGDIWELGDDDVFPKLKILKFRDLKIKQWIASKENFPYLQKLVMQECFELEEIPSSIGEIDSLMEIQVWWCSDCVNKSASLIQEEQKDFGNDSLIVRIVERRKSVSDSDEDSFDFGEYYFELAEDA